MQDLDTILTKFTEIVSWDFCNNLAKKCGFVQRSTSQLQGYEFAQAMMIPNAFLQAETLNSLAVRMQSLNSACNLSASALAQRINTKGAKEFMQACFGRVLKEFINKTVSEERDLQDLSYFSRFIIEDSTRIELDQRASKSFKGSGGLASKASIKINFSFDYFSEEFIRINFFSGIESDLTLSRHIFSELKPKDLLVRDLGYFILSQFQEIEEKGAYYVSRWKVNENVYRDRDSKTPFDLAKFLDKHIEDGQIDVTVFIGENRHAVRLVACRMCEEAVNKRRRNANKLATRRGHKISKKKIDLLKYSIFITNVPSEVLSGDSVMAIYRARWRVEMIFKEWKSCLKIHIFKGYNQERIYCFLYGRLIMILLIGKIYSILMQYAFSIGRELSGYKLINYLIADHAFARAFQKGIIERFAQGVILNIPRRLCRDKRKRFTLRKNIRKRRSYYEELNLNGLKEKIA